MKRKLWRHDIRNVPPYLEHALFKYKQDQRIALVWLMFKKYWTLEEAMEIIASGFCDTVKDWGELDRFSLDNGKTFVNGRIYL